MTRDALRIAAGRGNVQLRAYASVALRPDLLAGLTVAMIALPQAISYALLADMPPQSGLYAVVIASLAAAVFGSSNHLQTGPSNTASLLTLAALAPLVVPGTEQYALAAGLLAVMGGTLRVVLGLAKLGLLVRFVSSAVIVGFTAGANVLIMVDQLRNLLRLNVRPTGAMVQTVQVMIPRLGEAHLPSLALGLAVLLGLLLVRRWKPRVPGPLVVIVLSGLAVGLLRLDVKTVGSLPSGFPPFRMPPVTDLELVGNLSTAALSMAAIGLVEAMSIARVIAAKTGQRLDSNREFIGQGVANIAVGLFSGYPVTGSFGRSAANFQSGGRTRLAGAFSGLMVLFATLALAPLAAYIPMAALASILILNAYSLIDRREIARIWRGAGGDRVTMIVTLITTLTLPLHFAVLAGILVSLANYLLQTSTPKVRAVTPGEGFRHFRYQPDKIACPQLGILEIMGDLYFGAVEHIEDQVLRNQAANPGQRFLLLRMQSVDNCDISGVYALESIVRAYRQMHGDVFMMRVQPAVMEEMKASGFLAFFGEDHILNEDGAIGYLFYRVLDPAICIYECPVRVFKECQNLPKQLPDESQETHLHLTHPSVSAPVVAPRELWRMMHDDPQPYVIDVREPREFAQGHVPGSKLIPLPALLDDLSQAPHDRPVVLVCRGGRRSALAAAGLRDAGHPNAAALEGGMVAWEAANLLEAIT